MIKHLPVAACSLLLLNFSCQTSAARFMDTCKPASTPVMNSETTVCSTEFPARRLRRDPSVISMRLALLSRHLSTSIFPFIFALAPLRAEDPISACLWVTGGKLGDPETQGKRGDVIDIQRFDGLSVSG